MEEEFIDVNNVKKGYERARGRFEANDEISAHNKEVVLRFVREAALGKTTIGRAKKKVGPSQCQKYLTHLTKLIQHVKKDLDTLVQADMEDFIEALENDIIRSEWRSFGKRTSDEPLSPRYKRDIKLSVKKFYKWLWGRSKTYPEIVEWIDTADELKEVPALTEDEIGRMIDRSRSLVHKALIQVLFDGGLRKSELLNVRLRHVTLKRFDPNDPSRVCFCVRVPFSKTLRRTVAMPMYLTTKWLSLWLEEHPARPIIKPDGTIEAADVNMQLFPVSSNALYMMLRRIGRDALGKQVHPHLLRHTSATYWCNKLPYFKFCKRFGWTMTSAMPRRYIDREGVDELEVATIYHSGQDAMLMQENRRLKEQLVQPNDDDEDHLMRMRVTASQPGYRRDRQAR